LLIACCVFVAVGTSVCSGDEDPRRTPIVRVYEQCGPAVVHVTGPHVQKDTPSTFEFFAPPDAPALPQLVGAGFIIHPDGYMLTTAHGVLNLVSPRIILKGGERLPAEVLAVDPRFDVALLKIESADPLPTIPLAKSGDVLVGETIVAIGSPHGFQQTCSKGIVSALGRTTNPSGLPGVTLRDLIQGDAPINPGNSGGPWLNVLGQVIGMTTTRKDDAENIAFAVPSSSLHRVLGELLAAQRHPAFGLGMQFSNDGASTVADVLTESPAALAGLQVGDVIRTLGETPVGSSGLFYLTLIDKQAGDLVRVEFLRGDTPMVAEIILPELAAVDAKASIRKRLAIDVAPLSDEQTRAMHLRVQRGVTVESVFSGPFDKLEHSPAPGDVIARVGYIRPRDADHLARLLDRQPRDKPVPLVFLRHRNNKSTRIDVKAILP
jgi:serine protease Do